MATLGDAQDRIHEGGLSFLGLNNFGLTYRTGKPEALWRFNAMSVSADRRDHQTMDYEQIENTFGAHISAGREFRKNLADKLQFRYGFDFAFYYSRQKTRNESIPFASTSIQKLISWGPSAEAVLGLNYAIAERFLIGAEILPSLSMRKTENTSRIGDSESKNETTRFSFDLSSSSALLSLVYRF